MNHIFLPGPTLRVIWRSSKNIAINRQFGVELFQRKFGAVSRNYQEPMSSTFCLVTKRDISLSGGRDWTERLRDICGNERKQFA